MSCIELDKSEICYSSWIAQNFLFIRIVRILLVILIKHTIQSSILNTTLLHYT